MRASALVLLLLLGLCAGCGPTVDLATSLQVQDSSTGWFDLGIVNGQNKLVPSITFSLKNNSNQKLRAAGQALFRRADNEEWGSGFLRLGSSGLPPATATRSRSDPQRLHRQRSIARRHAGTAIRGRPSSSGEYGSHSGSASASSP